MKTLDFTPYTPDQFRTMAMGKARGFKWDTIADLLQVPVASIDCVAWTHEKQWNRALAKAESIVAREVLVDAVIALRADLRDAEPHHRPTITNSLTRVLKQQQDYAPKPRTPRERTGPVPTRTPLPPLNPITPVPPIVTEVRQTEVPSVKPPAELPPPTPKMTTDEMIAMKTRLRERLAAATCAFLALLCLCWLTLARAVPASNVHDGFAPSLLAGSVGVGCWVQNDPTPTLPASREGARTPCEVWPIEAGVLPKHAPPDSV
jgi:hypothetical protein